MTLKYSNLLPKLMNALMGPEIKRISKNVDSLIQQNSHLGGSAFAYIYQDKRYNKSNSFIPRDRDIKPIHKTLEEQADKLHKELAKVEFDQQKMKQSLSVVLSRCKNIQDVRDVLPETFVKNVPVFQGLDRQKEPGFLLDEFPALRIQYNKAIEISEYYMVNQILY